MLSKRASTDFACKNDIHIDTDNKLIMIEFLNLDKSGAYLLVELKKFQLQ